MNIIEYVKEINQSKVDVYNELDALAFVMSSYFEFEDVLSREQIPTYLKDIDLTEKMKETQSKLRMQHNDLVYSMVHSPKFNDIILIDYTAQLELDIEKQFSVTTYLIDEVLFVAFRGTDLSPVGWKEDFNMTFSQHVPAQQSALLYLNQLIEILDYPIVVGGHSKGGNLAVYASAFCDDPNRILKVYNFDGPGFRMDIIEKLEYQNILSKTVKFVPHAAIVGSFLNTQEVPIVIESKSFSFFQHNAYEWVIKDNQFVLRDDVTSISKHFSLSLQHWLEDISDDKRKYIVDEFYEAFKKLEIDSLEDIWKFLSIDTIRQVLSIHSEADPEFKEQFRSLFGQFIKQLFDLKKKGTAQN